MKALIYLGLIFSTFKYNFSAISNLDKALYELARLFITAILFGSTSIALLKQLIEAKVFLLPCKARPHKFKT